MKADPEVCYDLAQCEEEKEKYFSEWKGWNIYMEPLHLPGPAKGQHTSSAILSCVTFRLPLRGYLCFCRRKAIVTFSFLPQCLSIQKIKCLYSEAFSHLYSYSMKAAWE